MPSALLPKGCDLLLRTNCVLKLNLIGSASRGWLLSHDAHMRHGMPLALVLCWMCHGMSTSLVRSMSMIDPNLGLSNRRRQALGLQQLAVWQDAPPTSLQWLRAFWIFLCHVRPFLCHSHRNDNPCFHHRDIGIWVFLSFPSFLCLFPNMPGRRDHNFHWPYWPSRQN